MATVTFTSLKCVRKHDLTGDDEAEIWIGSRMIWNGVMSKGAVDNVGVDEEFSNSVAVTMKERDGDRDDHKFLLLGPITIRENTSSPATFKTSGTHYELSYFVRS
jgi:hypothetical protein